MADLSYEHQLENEVARQRDAADKAAALIGTLNDRLLHVRGEALGLLMRLQRIAERHTLAYEYLSDQEHQVNGICDRCRTPYPCEDRRDAEWNSKTMT